ncbi:MAG: hypothetical protein A3K68_00720 [Euryarchaeota archaeon RBG_16_68_13]|nr:MAG: hypothetical protein A3K68_00720 [Euryarchaeota archaeon RBG_16_68_13]
MSDLLLGQALAAFILAGTLAGGVVIYRRVRATGNRGARLAGRTPARWAEIAWPSGFVLVQGWGVGVLLAPSWFYEWPAIGPVPADHVIQSAGFGIWLAAGGLAMSAARALGRHMTPEIRVDAGHTLVQHGPFRRIRHPTYTANVGLAVGIGLAFLSPVVLVVAVILAVTARHRAVLEEELLRSPHGFGIVYDEYMKRTGRFLPGWGGNK